MPIKFRCGYCHKLLGIARRKAGTRTTCPHCSATLIVPSPEPDLDEIDALLNAGKPPTRSPASQPPPTEAPPPRAEAPEDDPLFERDLDSVLGPSAPPAQTPAENPRPGPTSGLDASSLGGMGELPAGNSGRVTALVVGVLLLLTLAFVAGFLLASGG